MQKTTFPFEAIVHDDASTDGSAAIIREYAEKYPDIIKPIYETENQYRKGTIGKIMDAAIHPNAKYIATCEGDDYWTDPNKLQIQVDFLESHPDFFSSSHNYSVYHEDTKITEHGRERFVNLSYDIWGEEEYYAFTNDDYYNIWFLQTLTTVRRNIKFIDDEVRSQFPQFFDYISFYYITKKGKCAFFKRDMATYRVHKGGVCSGSDIVTWNENYLKNCYVLYGLEKDNRVIPSMNRSFVNLVIQLLKDGQYKRVYFVLKRHNNSISIKNSISCVFLFLRRLSEFLH
jgi:glycosyltransferase involved in cell wall biosynthesis